MTEIYPVLLLRDIVIFPGMIVPLFVGREKSVKALDEASRLNKKILLITQKNPNDDDPALSEVFRTGIVCSILQLLKLPDGTVKALVEGAERANVTEFAAAAGFLQAKVEKVEEPKGDENDIKALIRTLIGQFEQYVKLNKKIPPEVLAAAAQITDPSRLADTVAGYLPIKVADKQKLLETFEIVPRLESVLATVEAEIALLNTERKIRSRVKRQMEKSQRDYYLNEQLKAIQKELGDGEEGKDEISDLEKKIKSTRLSKEATEKCLSELKKLRTMSPLSAEASVIRNYLDWMLTIPWRRRSKVKADIAEAQAILERDHFGLEKVKERILEYLAVQQRVNKMKGPILCLVGPPGVGKTSLGRSIAEATGRSFVKVALGGVRDEAEIRGHRRTYIGSMPGKMIQSVKKAKFSNPLFMLDEIDKMASDYRGDPAAALLEVLDPEQNSKFNDHYLEVDYDLSDVMFVATANTYNMPRPLLDRMEIIRISGYTDEEKLQIAKRHLVPKLKKSHGLVEDEWKISDDAVLDIIRHYTREAGVRSLERELANLARKAVKDIVSKKAEKIFVTRRNVEKYAGVRKFSHGESEKEDLVGITTGLAYTETGGDILSIEAVSIPGKGKITITGKLGDVMQESVQAAASFVKSRSLAFGITPPEYQKKDIHIHVPEGATPKDGPSAGVAMCTSLVSVLTGIPVKKSVAMTGEITLRGRVLAIGGLKEKLLAALRSGIKTVIIPRDNVKDLAEIPDNIKNSLEIIPVMSAEEALKIALVREPMAVEWSETENIRPHPKENDGEPLVTH